MPEGRASQASRQKNKHPAAPYVAAGDGEDILHVVGAGEGPTTWLRSLHHPAHGPAASCQQPCHEWGMGHVSATAAPHRLLQTEKAAGHLPSWGRDGPYPGSLHHVYRG